MKMKSEEKPAETSLAVCLKDIPLEGLDFSIQIKREDLDFGEGDPFFKRPLEFRARISATDKEAWVDGTLRGILLLECVRCLEAYHQEVLIPVQAHYHSPLQPCEKEQSTSVNAGEGTSETEEMESYPLLYRKCHLADMLREQIILSLPSYPVCQEACRGLCHVCGKNLNEEQCGCEEEHHDSPFAVLRDKLHLLRPGR